MNDNHSLSHSKWNCKYHIVFAPKYRRQLIYGQIKADIGKILRTLCEQKKVNNASSTTALWQLLFLNPQCGFRKALKIHFQRIFKADTFLDVKLIPTYQIHHGRNKDCDR